jgi:hypothetical protein
MTPGPCQHCGSPDRARQCRYYWYLPYRDEWKRSGADAPCYGDDYAETEMRHVRSLNRKNLLLLLLLAGALVAAWRLG